MSSLLVFSDDWGRHPSSCQHLTRRLLARHRVLWVNTIGTRPPRLDLATMRRGWEKMRQWLRHAPARVPAPAMAASGPAGDNGMRAANLDIANPKMWPWFRSRFDRWLNRRLLVRQLSSWIGAQGELPVAVTTLPIVADLMGSLPVSRWVYYCVDDFSEWPGLDGAALQKMEEVVVQRAGRIIVVSETLRDKLAGMGRTADLLTHGVDLDFWQRCGSAPPPALETLERPLVVFWGVIDRRLDVSWLRALAAGMTRGTIVLAGPEADPDPALFACPRVVRVGSLPFEQLPGLAHEASVLIMPYADLPVTRAIQPLKLKEYLATGKPTVVRDLPATRPWCESADVVMCAETFVRTVLGRIEGLPPAQRLARERLRDEGWEEKACRFEDWVFAEEPARARSACG